MIKQSLLFPAFVHFSTCDASSVLLLRAPSIQRAVTAAPAGICFSISAASFSRAALISLSDKMSDDITLALSDSENDRGGVIIALNGKGEKTAELAVSEDITALDGYKKYIAYLSDGRLNIYNTRSKELNSYETDLDAFSVSSGKDGVYTLGVTKIEKHTY